MVDAMKIKQDMAVIGADGVTVGMVDEVVGGRIKLKKTETRGFHGEHHHYISLGLVADVEGDKIRLSPNAAVAVTFEEEKSGAPA